VVLFSLKSLVEGGMSSEVLEDLLKIDIHEDTWEWWKSHLYFLQEDKDLLEAEPSSKSSVCTEVDIAELIFGSLKTASFRFLR
jgi:hypothetical protein